MSKHPNRVTLLVVSSCLPVKNSKWQKYQLKHIQNYSIITIISLLFQTLSPLYLTWIDLAKTLFSMDYLNDDIFMGSLILNKYSLRFLNLDDTAIIYSTASPSDRLYYLFSLSNIFNEFPCTLFIGDLTLSLFIFFANSFSTLLLNYASLTSNEGFASKWFYPSPSCNVSLGAPAISKCVLIFLLL